MCVKLKGSFAFNMEKFPSLENFYTHAVTGVTDNYQVCTPVHCSVMLFPFASAFSSKDELSIACYALPSFQLQYRISHRKLNGKNCTS